MSALPKWCPKGIPPYKLIVIGKELRTYLGISEEEKCADAFYVDNQDTPYLVEKKGKHILEAVTQLKNTYNHLKEKCNCENIKLNKLKIFICFKRIPKELANTVKFVRNSNYPDKILMNTLSSKNKLYDIDGYPIYDGGG